MNHIPIRLRLAVSYDSWIIVINWKPNTDTAWPTFYKNYYFHIFFITLLLQ